MPDVIVTEPATEPVTRGQAKLQLRLETDEDDSQVDTMVSAARRHVEAWCNRAVVKQTWKLFAPNFWRCPEHGHSCWVGCQYYFGAYAPYGAGFGRRRHADRLELTRGRLYRQDPASVAWVKYIDASGVEQTLDPSVYSVDAASAPGSVRLAHGKSWPDVRQQWDAVRVQFTVGWDDYDVPEPIRQAVLILAAHMYERRTPEVDSRTSPILFSVEALLAPFKVHAL